MSGYFDLGSHSWQVSTHSSDAQIWFDRGLNWTYGFNHVEAVKCFQRVLDFDPACPMAYWGIAFAAGPNYNKMWERFDQKDLALTFRKTYDATRKAIDLAGYATPMERALIETLPARYPSPEPLEDFQRLYDDYANVMRDVYQKFGDHLDITTLFANALMCRTPWMLWDLHTGTVAKGASTVEATEVLERALSTPEGQRHPGLNHMYVHLMEMSPHPERALRAADTLRGLAPESGHLEHMPTHIDVLCGHYQNVVTSNQRAIEADLKYVEHEGKENFYTILRVHNYHFKVYGAMFLGQYQVAVDAAEQLVETIPMALMHWKSPPMAQRLEGHFGIKLHVLIRFGKWQEILDTPLPEDPELFVATTAMIHYAKGVAYSATGRIVEAETERELFWKAHARIPENERFIYHNTCVDILHVAAEMLNGELEYRRGNYDQAYEHLRNAIYLEENLIYTEPWGWMQPTRHAYGALLLEQGHVEEAARAYREDLGFDPAIPRAYHHPENVWSLHGYHECLVRLGRLDEAAIIKQRFDLAAARADVPIQASCYCRMSLLAS